MKKFALYLTAVLLMVAATLAPERIALYRACCAEMKAAVQHDCCSHKAPVQISSKSDCCEPHVVQLHQNLPTLTADTQDHTVAALMIDQVPSAELTSASIQALDVSIALNTGPPGQTDVLTQQSRFNL